MEHGEEVHEKPSEFFRTRTHMWSHSFHLTEEGRGSAFCLRALQSDKWMMLWHKICAPPDVG